MLKYVVDKGLYYDDRHMRVTRCRAKKDLDKAIRRYRDQVPNKITQAEYEEYKKDYEHYSKCIPDNDTSETLAESYLAFMDKLCKKRIDKKTLAGLMEAQLKKTAGDYRNKSDSAFQEAAEEMRVALRGIVELENQSDEGQLTSLEVASLNHDSSEQMVQEI